jgi:pimeloyl-ACP methyl ester carboxylesterase
MARFLLVHGAAHGAWCWRDVIPALAALGHQATAIDMPGHGSDKTPIEEVTLQDYADRIVSALSEETIVVGHSMGGFPITLAAETDPTQIARLVYLCAYTPWPGMSLSQMRAQSEEQPLLPLIRISDDKKSFTFDIDGVENGVDTFYHDCPAETVAFARANLCPESTAASGTPLDLTLRSDEISKSYIVCSEDRAIPPEWQRRMAARLPESDVYTLQSSHSPFFSMPDRLAQTLDTIAQKDA